MKGSVCLILRVATCVYIIFRTRGESTQDIGGVNTDKGCDQCLSSPLKQVKFVITIIKVVGFAATSSFRGKLRLVM